MATGKVAHRFGPVRIRSGSVLPGYAVKIRTVERILFVLGVTLLGVWGVSCLHSMIGSWAAIHRFAANEASTPARDSFSSTGLPSDLPVDSSQWPIQRLTAHKDSLIRKTDLPLAILRIPKIGLQAPVFNDTDDLTLNRGVGRILGTAQIGQSGNLGIAGHRDGFFRGLQYVGIGDILEVERPRQTDTYIVREIRIVNPDDVSVLNRTQVPTLTLITCYPFYFIGHAPKRYIVTAAMESDRQTAFGDDQGSGTTGINEPEKEQRR